MDKTRVQRLFTLNDLDSALTGPFPTNNFIRLYENGNKKNDGYLHDLSSDGWVPNIGAMKDALETGLTLMIRFTDKRLDPLGAATKELEKEWGYPVINNVIISKGGTTGLRPHFDELPVLWIQIAGEKHLVRWDDLPFPAIGESYVRSPIGERTVHGMSAGDWILGTPQMLHSALTPAGSNELSIHTVFLPRIHRLSDVVLATTAPFGLSDDDQQFIKTSDALKPRIPPRAKPGKEVDAMRYLMGIAGAILDSTHGVPASVSSALDESAKNSDDLVAYLESLYSLPAALTEHGQGVSRIDADPARSLDAASLVRGINSSVAAEMGRGILIG